MAHILVLEDDLALSAGLCFELDACGHLTVAAYHCEKARQLLEKEAFDLALFDVNLPDGSGFDLCREVKEKYPNLPVLFLTANDLEEDVLKGFDLGADDYITKPFSIRELMARVKANIRRAAMAPQTPAPAPEGEALRFGRLVIQKGEATATKDGADLELTPREFELLAYLASHAGRVFSRQELMERVWNYEGYVGDVRAVDVAIRRLREKVEDDPAQPKYIITRRGAGYYFQQEP